MRFRSILILIVAAIASFSIHLTAFAAPAKVKAPTYTPAQIEQIQTYADGVKELRDRLLEIPPLVQQKRWIDVQSFLHGPLGELRFRTGKLTRSLDPSVQKAARETEKEIFEKLMLIDEATKTNDAKKALRSYNAAIAEFDKYLQFIPQ